MLKIYIIIPFKNSETVIKRSLQSIYESNIEPYEVIAVNDHSDDASVKIVKSFPCRLLNNSEKYGVSSARNLGAKKASGDILLFIDSDIVLKKNTLEKLHECYENFEIDGVVGLLAEKTEFDGFYSQYKNLWMRYTYILLKDKFPPFYSSIASIHKKDFLEAGGFMESYCKPSVEDTVFGNKLFESGYKIRLCPEVEVLHIKEYSFSPLITTDLKRGAGLTKFFLGNSPFLNLFALISGKKKIITSVPSFFFLSFFIEFVFLALSILEVFRGNPLSSLYFLIAGWILTNISNYKWLAYLKKVKGGVFSIKAFFFIPVEVFFSMLAGILGFFKR